MKQPNPIKPKTNDQGWWMPTMLKIEEMEKMRGWLSRTIEWRRRDTE